VVAAAQDKPVGFCFVVLEPMTEAAWNMLALAVAPDHHRTGTGAALVAALEAQLAEGGARLLMVDTASDPDKAPARAFYKACGYAGPNCIPSFWVQGSDKLTQWKK
jgi:GNAT superfamily N-acetyltransferase